MSDTGATTVLDPTLADECHVRGPATHVHEERTGLADLVGAEDAGDGVRLGDDLQQLQVQLTRDRLKRAQVNEWSEGVEDPDLDVSALEPDRVGQGVAVDLGPGDTPGHPVFGKIMGR